MARASVLTVLGACLLLSACTQRSAEQQVAAAKASLEKGDHRIAVVELKDALQREPGLKEARLLLGRALLRAGDTKGAQIELRNSAEQGALPTGPFTVASSDCEAALARERRALVWTDVEPERLPFPFLQRMGVRSLTH